MTISFGKRKHSVLKPSGHVICTPLDGSKETQVDLVHCCHCSRLWIWEVGSGKKRGWCLKCNGITCGSELCDVCVPKEKQVENLDKGLPSRHVDTTVSVAIPDSKLWVPPNYNNG